MWADSSGILPFASTAANQFLIRAAGGVGVGTNNPDAALDVAGNIHASGRFYGDGSGLTSLGASNLTGTLGYSSLPKGLVTNGSGSLVVGGTSTNVMAPLTVPPNVPASPISSSPRGMTALVVADHYAYAASDLLVIYDVSVPSAPVVVGSVTIPGGVLTPASPLAVAGGNAYVVTGSNRLQIFDVSNPANPVSVGSASTGTGPASVSVAGRHACVVNSGDSTLQVFDVSKPAAPASIASVTTSNAPQGVVVSGRYAYVAAGALNTSGCLQIFDVSAPATPISVGSVGGSFVPEALAVSGRYAYVGDDGSFGFMT